MAILITRPDDAGVELVTMLNRKGIEAYHTPLFRISSGRELSLLPYYINNLKKGDLVFAVSIHAVNYAEQLLCQTNTSWPDDVTYFSIGKTTATALTKATRVPVIYPNSYENSEHLLAVTELAKISGKQALILRGNNGRKLLGDTLQQRGASVTYCECYRRIMIDYDVNELVKQWQAQHIDTIVITSNTLLVQLIKLVPVCQRAWLIRCRLVVVSERIAKMASQLGWYNVSIVNSSNNSRLLNVFEQPFNNEIRKYD